MTRVQRGNGKLGDSFMYLDQKDMEQCLLIISFENASFEKVSKFLYDRDNQYSIGFLP